MTWQCQFEPGSRDTAGRGPEGYQTKTEGPRGTKTEEPVNDVKVFAIFLTFHKRKHILMKQHSLLGLYLPEQQPVGDVLGQHKT